jgi:hypothetical protein
MFNTIAQYLGAVNDPRSREALRVILSAVGDALSSQTLGSAALVIKAGGGVLAKSGAAFYATAQGKIVNKAINTDMAALSGTVTNARFNVYCFFIDAAGVLTSAMGIEATTLAGVKFPPIPGGKAMIGFVVINPTGTGNFVGNTTPLDDATVVPNAAYVNTVGAFDPTVLPQ